jgi:1,4-dihydroxy-6-naphthoate synthase
MKLTLGFSPCPNDTFIFDGLVNGLIDTEGLEFDFHLEDVETLNQWSREEKLDITKLSFGTLLYLTKPYSLLHAGSALGKGVGPLLVSKKEIAFKDISQFNIAIPGEKTTANLLLSLAAPNATKKTEVLFSEIEEGLLNNQFDVGLIIHESRFTYERKGLYKILDLGDWWENTMKAAIPLGGIVMKRSFDPALIKKVDLLIKKSIDFAWTNYPMLSNFVKNNAQEMDESVMRQHIQLYVNEFSSDLGSVGLHSIETLFNKANEVGLIAKHQIPPSFFY